MARRTPLLFDALPTLARRVPWTPLADVPTAVEPCEALADYFGRGGIFMKRDDLVSKLYGGNKVRRYEFALADALAKGARTIVTAGGLGSTQVMATALFGRELGFRVHAVLFDQPVTAFVRESVLGFAESGATIEHGGGYLETAWLTRRALREHEASYLILPGAPNPTANLGYVDAMLELAEQVARGEAPRPDVIVLPTGSSGTLAALALGAAHLGWSTEIVGVRITSALACNRLTVQAVVASTDRFLTRSDPAWRPARARARWSLFGGAVGAGYGHPTPDAISGSEKLRDLVGSVGEITYTGKALAGLRHLAQCEAYRDKTILLWNTLSSRRRAPSARARELVPRSLDFVFDGAPVA